MIIVSQSEFRKNQKMYFDILGKERVVITQRGSKEVVELVKKTRIEEVNYLTENETINTARAEIERSRDK